jgi:hypothetical protein
MLKVLKVEADVKRSINTRRFKNNHLALNMKSSEVAHTGGERENNGTKQQEGKTWASKAQQDLPINMANYNWLLICKA